MNWNGLDDQMWPYTRTLDALATRFCGLSAGWAQSAVDELYRTKSVVPEEEMGGNGGRSFRKELSKTTGRCRFDFESYGARWNYLIVEVQLTGGS